MAETQVETFCDDVTVTSATAELTPSQRAVPMEVREQCKLLYYQGVKLQMIQAQTGVRAGTVRNWASRYGWGKTVTAGKAILIATGGRALIRETSSQLDGQSARLRKKLADVIEKGADALQEVTVKATPKAVRKLGEAIETLTRSAKIVHSWGSEGPVGIVLGDLLGAEHERQSSIEIAASVAESPCGIEATTGSVPPTKPSDTTPQSAQ